MRKPRMIIIEGTDGLYKSTIAKKLSDYYGYPVKHSGPVKSMEEGRDEYFGHVNNIDYDIIFDRFHGGEATYSQIYRGYKANYFKELVQAMEEKFDVYLFVMHDSADNIIKRLNVRGEDFLKMEDVEEVCSLFYNFYYDSTVDKKWIVRLKDCTSDDIVECMKNIIGDVI